MAVIDPVWSSALADRPRVLDALSAADRGDSPLPPLFYRLGDLLRALGTPPPRPTPDPVETFLIDLFGLYLDWPSWTAKQLVDTVDARLSVRERGAPTFLNGVRPASECDEALRDYGTRYLVVVWGPTHPVASRLAHVSFYRVVSQNGRLLDRSIAEETAADGTAAFDPLGDLIVTGTIAQFEVDKDGADDEYVDDDAFRDVDISAPVGIMFPFGTLTDVAGALPRFSYALAIDTLKVDDGGGGDHPMHRLFSSGGRSPERGENRDQIDERVDHEDRDGGEDDEDDARDARQNNTQDIRGMSSVTNDPSSVGALAVRDALVPLLAFSPRIAQQVMAQGLHGTDFEPSLVNAHAALLSPCELGLVLGQTAAADVARDLGDIWTRQTPGSLADLSVAAIASAPAYSESARLLAALPQGVREKAAFATWQSVCSEAPSTLGSGRLPHAGRLLDVADALQVPLTDAQLRYPERLCPDLLDAAVRAGAAAYHGATPVTPHVAPAENPLYEPAALALVRHERGGDSAWPYYRDMDRDGWAGACRIDHTRRLSVDEARALVEEAAVSQEDDHAFDDYASYQSIMAAVTAAADAAKVADAPLVFEPADDMRSQGDSAAIYRERQRQRTAYETAQSDAAGRVRFLAPLVAQAIRAGAVLDPDDIVYPGRLCARMALYRALAVD